MWWLWWFHFRISREKFYEFLDEFIQYISRDLNLPNQISLAPDKRLATLLYYLKDTW